MASAANMLATLRWQRSDQVDYDEIATPIRMGFPLLLDMVTRHAPVGAVARGHDSLTSGSPI